MEEKTPKVFISYSWSSDKIALELAQRLTSHGVDVVIDKWELKEGQDKYEFMERCVSDQKITKVLIICDKIYAQKANDRTGGVGDETVIISSELYGNMRQEKFIPIIVEKDEDGNPYAPTYIKTRIHIDLSDSETYEAEYEKLLRNIYEKPQFTKPKLGKRPEWLDDEKIDFFPLKDLIRQIRGSNTNNKRKNCISKFQAAYIEALKAFFEKNANPERIYEIFLNTKSVRDIFLDFVEVIEETDSDYAEILAESFEMLYNQLTCIRTFEPYAGSACYYDLAVFKIHVWELFICVIAFMRHLKDYAAINMMLTYTYFLNSDVLGNDVKPSNYMAFWDSGCVIDEYYESKAEMKDKFTLIGDTIFNQREKLPIYTGKAIAEADLFLYQVCKAYDLARDERSWQRRNWFPVFYVYVRGNPIEWNKMKSRQYCEKMMVLFGVDSLDDLKTVIKRCTYDNRMKYPHDIWNAAPAILSYIKAEEIGSLN